MIRTSGRGGIYLKDCAETDKMLCVSVKRWKADAAVRVLVPVARLPKSGYSHSR